jgi:apolipoprotein N-acyltransferase
VGRTRRWFGRPARWLAFLAGGVPAVLVFPAPSVSYLAWAALVPGMLLFTRAPSIREAVARGWWFGAGYLIAMLYWLAPEIGPGLLAVGGVAGGLYAPFAVAVNRLLGPPLRWHRAMLAFLVVPSCWLVPEWARSYQGLGGPWGLYGASQWQHPTVLALAAIGGVWLISAALVMANTAGMIILITATSAGRGAGVAGRQGAGDARGFGTRQGALAAFGLVAFAVAAGAGPLAFALTPPFPVQPAVTVALVQPGLLASPVAQSDASETLTAGESNHGAFGNNKALDLIVWGESSIDEDLTLPSSRPLLTAIGALSARAGADILVSQDATVPGKGHEKWGVLVSPAGVGGIYVKTRLVPFGEYIPFRQQLGWLTLVSRAAAANMEPGAGAHLMHAATRSGSLPIGVLTCFESAFPDMSRVDADLGARLLVYQSATLTFQGTWGPDQHASLAALRAAETGRPAVQAALTGDSAAFDARGRKLAWLGQSGHGVAIARLALPAASSRTFYDTHGDYVMWSGVVISVIFVLLMLTRRRGFLVRTAGGAGDHEAQYEADSGQPVAG